MKKTKKSTRTSKLIHQKKKFSFAGKRKKFVRKNNLRLPSSLDRLRRERYLASWLASSSRTALKRMPTHRRSAIARIQEFGAIQRSRVVLRQFLARTQRFTVSYLKAALACAVVVRNTRRNYRTPTRLTSFDQQRRLPARLPLSPLMRVTGVALRVGTSRRKYLAAHLRVQKLCVTLRKSRAASRLLRRRRRPTTSYRRWRFKRFKKRYKAFKKVLAKISKTKRRLRAPRRQLRVRRFYTVRKRMACLVRLRFRSVRKKRRMMHTRIIKRWWWRRAPLRRRRRRSRARFSYPNKRHRWRLSRRDPRHMKRTRQYRAAKVVVINTAKIESVKLNTTRARRKYRAFALVNTQQPNTDFSALGVFRRRVLRRAVRRINSKTPLRLQRMRLDTQLRYASIFHSAARTTPGVLFSKKVVPQLAIRAKSSRYRATRLSKLREAITRSQVKSRRAAYKLQTQRALRGGVILHSKQQKSLDNSFTATTRFMLHSREDHRLYGSTRVFGSKSARNQLFRKIRLQTNGAVIVDTIPSATSRAVRFVARSNPMRGCSTALYNFKFLQNPDFHVSTQKHTLAEMRGEALLFQKQRRYRAFQITHRRPKLRLPGVKITRFRRRKSGLVAFTHNSLKQPRTLAGQQHQLLPPVSAYGFAIKYRHLGRGFDAHTLTAYERRHEALPVFWKRPHTRANSKAISKIRRRMYNMYRRFYQKTRQRAYLRVAKAVGQKTAEKLQLHIPHASSFLEQNAAVTHTPYGASTYLQHSNVTGYSTKFVSQSRRKPAVQKDTAWSAAVSTTRTLRYITPVVSQTSEASAVLTNRRAVNVRQLHALWQVRSVREMLKSERQLSAWSPQISARNRRKHYPRVGSVPLPRRRLTFRAKRIRNTDNAARLRRGVPQLRYTDHTRVKLQYFFGSVGSTGYKRLRRVHRLPSDHSRWWRATKRAVPFSHPYSRRSLNATRYRKAAFNKMSVPVIGDFTYTSGPVSGLSLHTKFPPRTIPWRNFHYRRPKYKDAPKTLQRWTFTSRVGKTSRVRPISASITITRSPRALRKLHTVVSGRGAYKNYGWGTLDNTTLNAAGAAQFSFAVRCIPASVWSALRTKVGHTSTYAMTRRQIFGKLRQWIRSQQVTAPVLSKKMPTKTVQILITFIRAAMADLAAGRFVATVDRHSCLRVSAFSARVQQKALQYLKLNELPSSGIEFAPGALLRREQSKAYKRWLSGAESTFKRSQAGYTPTSRSRYTENVAINFGRRRARFPASGRRRKSYDSLLHAFAKKISPARFRRVSKLRFRWVKPKLSGDFQENVNTLTPLFGASRRQYTARKLSSVAYLSVNARELFGHRAAIGESRARATALGTKRRFLSLPLLRSFKRKRSALRRASAPYRQQMYSIRAGTLRRALRRRRKERIYIDLRQAVRQRRLPREKPQSYRRLQRKRNLRRRFAARRGKYSRKSMRKRSKSSSRWTLRHLSAIGPRRGRKRKARLAPILSYGEDVTVSQTVFRKRARAVRGFTPPTSRRRRRKLRRRARDSFRRKRRARRGKRINRRRARRRVNHWSEKRLRRLRKNSFSLRKTLTAKSFAQKIRGKVGGRFALARVHRSGSSRLLHFFSRKASAAAHGIPRIPSAQPATTDFTKTSFMRTFRYAKRFYDKSRLIRRRGRSLAPYAPALRRTKVLNALSVAQERATGAVPKRLLASLECTAATTPLWFEAPVTRTVKSAAVKEQEAAAAIAAKEGSFRLPAQYVEGVTTLIPELMNYMLSQRIKNKELNYSTTRQAIRNIYWSLRVYLNVDPFDNRFFVRDKVPGARVRIFEEITNLSVFQKTLQPDRAALRYRFQPSRLVRSKNTARFREDWLRAFFPARHALYQENSEDYGKFLVATHRIRRLRIGPRDMKSWRTVVNLGGLEIRARQLLKLRFSRRRSRFETILQTTRRLSTEEPAPRAPTLPRTSFFVRSFSTYSNRGLGLTARWIHRRKRFVALNSGWRTVTPAALATTRCRLLPRLEARGRSRYITTDWAGITNSLSDGRFSRSKSPRSRQYLIRLPKKFVASSKQKKLTDLIFYEKLYKRHALKNTQNSAKWTRTRRGTWSTVFKRTSVKDLLAFTRHGYILRRVQDALFSRRTRTNGANLPKTTRSILHSRRPSQRTAFTTYKKATMLRASGVFGARSFKHLREVQKKLKSKYPRSFNRKPRFKMAMRPTWRTHNKRLRAGKPAVRGMSFGRTLSRGRTRQHKDYFASSAGWQITRGIDMAKAAAMHTRVRRQTPFETFRPRLWNKLTLRWMKKFRIGKYWIRDTSYWLRDPWLSKIVAPDMSLRRDRFGGELRSRPQQVGEYVADVNADGRDIRRANAPRERHKFQRILPEKEDTEIKKTNRILKYGSASSKTIALHRLQIASQARRKPVPTMRLANYEYRDVIREHKEEKAKSAKQKTEEEQARVVAYWARKAKRLAPVRPRRLPLKHPANLWLPHVIWKDIQRRVRKFDWRESDQVFARRGYRGAFRFRPAERRKASWLEPLMYTRVAYSTRLKSFRRRQFPHEQKKFKWLQRVRKTLYPGRRRRYIKRRRWPQLRRYNQKLHYSLFNLRDRGAARRHFKRLNGRTRPTISAFVSMSKGLTDRLDVTCLKMQFAPTIYWARIVSEFGLLRVNGVTVYDPSYRLKPADVIYPNWDVVARFQHFFQPYLTWRQLRRNRNRASTAFYPTNMEYQRSIRAIIYKHAPDESDLRRRSRVHPTYLRWFKLDSI